MDTPAQHETHPHETRSNLIQMPAPTAWPIVLAFGLTLTFGGLLLSPVISLLGIVLALFGSVGWFRQVLPHEHHEMVPTEVQEISYITARPHVAQIIVDESHRARLPLETPPVMSGVKGGLAGGAAMIVPALVYGLISPGHSIWYPINLLGGAGVARWANPTTADIAAFHWNGLIIASIIQLVTSVLVGLLYGAMLPMFPRRPILLGGVIAPVLWTGLLHSSLDIVNPFFSQRISWGWFLVSQVAFGVVAGWVVSRQSRIRTGQYLPFAVRMGIEAPGLMHEKNPEDGEK